jgi:purine-binding chemotaxis protein CheW
VSDTTREISDRPSPAATGPGPSGRTGGAGRYLTFTLGTETYAVSILEVSEIIEFRALTVVPMMPPYIRGVVNLRGRVLPVVDLSARFGRPPTVVGRRTGVIVVELVDRPAETNGAAAGAGVQGIGIMVDAVNKVVHLNDDDIEPVPAFGTGIRSDFISGMAKYDGTFIVVLKVERVLSLDEMAMIDQAAATAEGSSGEFRPALVTTALVTTGR